MKDEVEPILTTGRTDGFFPLAQLFVDGVTVEAVKNLIDVFDLKITYGSSKGYTLRTKNIEPGLHKLQSITLFGASLFLLERYPECKLVLSETFLNTVAISQTEIQAVAAEATSLAPDFTYGEGKNLSLSPAVQNYLTQSGFEINLQENYLKIPSGSHGKYLNRFLEALYTKTKRVG